MAAPVNWTSDNVTQCFIFGHWSNGHVIGQSIMVHRDEADAPSSARDVLNNWQDHIVPQQQNNYFVDGIRYRDRNEDPGVTGELGPDPDKPLHGTGAGASTSPQCSVLVKKLIVAHVGLRGGLLYHGPPAEAAVDEDGNFDPETAAGFQTSYDDFWDGLGGGGTELCVVHLGGASVAQERTSSIVTALQVQLLTATQRRRLR